MRELELAGLSPETQSEIASALGTWASPLKDFYDALTIGVKMPHDVSAELVRAFFEQVLAAQFALPEYD